jgi:precorrin-6A/cobalt-precorrin-6A reductase
VPALRVLILGGTAEARALADALSWADVVTSLAGRTAAPALPTGEVRIGGFGGRAGLAAYLADERIGAVVDATHPFAAAITASAVSAAATAGVPLVVLRRPGWTAGPGDDWRRVPSLAAAAQTVPPLGERVFLTIGRQGAREFAGVGECWFLIRCVDPPSPPLPPRHEVLLDRGPFALDGELALLRGHRIDVLVTKDSGGPMTAAKLAAARELAIPVVMVDRPPMPAAPTVDSVAAAIAWLTEVL